MVDFIFVVTELFSLSPKVETLRAEISRSQRFSKGGSPRSEAKVHVCLPVCGTLWCVLLQHYYIAIIFHRRVWYHALSLSMGSTDTVRSHCMHGTAMSLGNQSASCP